jgi:nucleoside-diphosphate-sugar epimerase
MYSRPGLAFLCLWAITDAYNVLIIGGTRFSGAALWKELYDRGHTVTVYNRGKTPAQAVVRESADDFDARIRAATFLQGDRQDPEQLRRLIDPDRYDYVYDMNAREEPDTKPLASLFVGHSQLKQYVFMSSAGVYLLSDEMPHLETDAVDANSRHKGKLESEACLQALGIPWCSFRPTYICGPGNYNPVERYFFERLEAGRPVCVPSHGQHLTGLGHVEDLAVAMANVVDRHTVTTGKTYNVQNRQAITFDGVVRTAAAVTGRARDSVEIVHYDPGTVEFPAGAKAFPMRPQHFFCGVERAVQDLEWTPRFDTVEAILRDSYENDFVPLRDSGGLRDDFVCDDIVLQKIQGVSKAAAEGASV